MSEIANRAQLTADERAMAEWNNEVAQADEVIGYSLIGGKENEETLDKLVGVPFLIEMFTFRQGDINIAPKGQTPVYRDYMSVHALIHPAHQAKFRRNRVVVNDGSTGIYRQGVAYLAAHGAVTVDESKPENGPANETRYDVSFSTPSTPGEPNHPVEIPVRLFCPEGLRKSSYTNEYGEAQTWYFA
jgi:hypothetical protein